MEVSTIYDCVPKQSIGMAEEEAILAFLSLFREPPLHEDGLLQIVQAYLQYHSIPHHVLNQGLYLAAKNRYFQCVAFLVQERGALFEAKALDKLCSEEDAHYTVNDMVNVVRAAYHERNGHSFLGGLKWEYALNTLVHYSRTPLEEQILIQVLPMVITLPEHDSSHAEDMELSLSALDVALYVAARHKQFLCVECLAQEYNAQFNSDFLVYLVGSSINFTFEEAMTLKDAVEGGHGLDPDAQDEEGNTILHIYCIRLLEDASVRVNFELVKEMVQWGVKPSIINNAGETAYTILWKINEEDPINFRVFSPEEKLAMRRIMQYIPSPIAG